MTRFERTFARGDVTRGLIAGAGLIATGARAQTAPPPTPESPLGPFYPIHHLAENDADLAQLRGHARRAQGNVI